MKYFINYLIAIILFVFGLLTLFLSSSIFFDWFGIREKEGNYVLFVVIANFIASILYLLAAWNTIKKKAIAAKFLWASVAVLVLAFAGLLIHINSGGIYEPKTVSAMIFRIAFTTIFAIAAYLTINRKNREEG